MTPPRSDAAELTRVGPYRVVRRIGSGGTAVVFEAEDERINQRVAIKVLHGHVAERPGAGERFLREARAIALLRHPHVVQVIGVGEDHGAPYLAMELLDGGSLAAMLARLGRLEVKEAIAILLPVVSAMHTAHEAGLIHRDIKPSNIVFATLCDRPWPKVVDFGLSKVLAARDAAELTASDKAVGTVAYMAPEQARSARQASFLSDQYAFSVVLYQCITGRLPFGGDGVYGLLQAIMTAPVIPPSVLAPTVSEELDEVVLRAMSREPRDRFESLRAFGRALLRHASEQSRASWSDEFASSSAARWASFPTTPSDAAGDVAATMVSGENRSVTGARVQTVAVMALVAASTAGLMMSNPHGRRSDKSEAAQSNRASAVPEPGPATANPIPTSAPSAFASALPEASSDMPAPAHRRRENSAIESGHSEALPPAPTTIRIGERGSPILP
jgi:serine/threonine protein kinase